MNWGGFAGGFAQGLNQTFDVKGLTRYMLSPEYRQSRIMAEAAAEAKGVTPETPTVADTVKSNGVSGAETPKVEPVKTEAPVAATTTTPTDSSTNTATPGDGIKAIVADQTTADTKTPVAETKTPVAETATPAATTPAKPATQQSVAQNNGVAVANPTEAKPQQPSIETQMQKTLAIARRKYAEAGDLENAEKLDRYIQSERGKAATKTFTDGWNALTVGNDVNKAVQKFGEYYTKYVDDGIDFTKGEITKDGQIAITTKRKDDGTENVITMSRGQLLRMGMAYNPVKLYEMNLTEAVDAEKQAAKVKGDIAKEDRQFTRDIEKMTIEKQLDAANVAGKERRAITAKVSALREAGYSQEFINQSMPAILGIGDKKSTSPEEARRLAHSDRMKNDPMYARKSSADQTKILDQDMATIYAGMKPTQAPAAPANPAAGGLPAPAGGGKGVPVYDTKTGQIVYK